MEEENKLLDPQDVYNAAYNFALGEEFKDKYIKSKIPYDPNWIYSNDNRIIQALGFGLDDGEIARRKYEKMEKINMKEEKKDELEFVTVEKVIETKEEKASKEQKKQKQILKGAILTILGAAGIGGCAILNQDKEEEKKEPALTLDSGMQFDENGVVLYDPNLADYDYSFEPYQTEEAENLVEAKISDKSQRLHEIYNASYNYALGQDRLETTLTYDEAWLTDEDPAVVNAAEDGLADGKSNKENQEKTVEEANRYQEIYNAAYNYALGDDLEHYKLETTLTYDEAWLTDDDPLVSSSARYGLEDGKSTRDMIEAILGGEDVSKEESKKEDLNLQEVYNASYNYASSSTDLETPLTYTSEWLVSADAAVVKAAQEGLEDGANTKQLKAEVEVKEDDSKSDRIQEIYNAAYNYSLGKDALKTSLTYDEAWLTDKDQKVAITAQYGLEDGKGLKEIYQAVAKDLIKKDKDGKDSKFEEKLAKKEQNIQEIYNAAYNHGLGQDKLETSLTYDEAWLTDKDKKVAITAQYGLEDGEGAKKIYELVSLKTEIQQAVEEAEKLNLQDVYDASFNYALGVDLTEYYLPTPLTYDEAWLQSDDDGVVRAASDGIEDGSKAKEAYGKTESVKEEGRGK